MERLTTDQIALVRVALTTIKNTFDAGTDFHSDYQELCNIFEAGCGIDVRNCEEESERQLMDDTVILDNILHEWTEEESKALAEMYDRHA